MTLRRICTIEGQAYRMTDYCNVCGDPMWVTLDTPTRTAGCTGDACIQNAVDATPAERRRPTPAPAPDPDPYSEDDGA